MSEQLLRQLFEAAPMALVMVARDGTIVLANRAAETVFGWPHGQLAGHRVEELVPVRFAAQHPAQRAAFAASPSARAMGAGRDLFGRRQDGSEVPIEIGLNPIRTAEGDYVLAAIVDISQRTRLEASLRQSEARLRTVVESAPNAMLMVGPDGAIVLVNSQVEVLFGWPRDELLGRPVEVLVPERFRAQHPARRGEFFAAPSTRAMGAGRDLFGLRRDGTEVPIEIGLNPISTSDGTFVLAAIIDITQRKQAEAAMRRSLLEKETLLREIHHRVKNNMQLVSSILGLQGSVAAGAGNQDALEACRGRVRSMALVHEQLYRGDALASIEFDRYVQELVRMLHAGFAGGDHIALELTTDAITIDVDTAVPAGLVLNELVTNAFKHAFAGRPSGRLWVDLRRIPGGKVELSVADDGAGLPADFDERGANTLGLRVVRSLARQLDGEVVVERSPRTCFRLHLPLRTITSEATRS